MTEVSDSPGLAMAERGLFGLQILAGDVEGFMLAEGELGRMDAAIRAGGQGAAFKAVAGAVAPVKPRRDRVCLEDVGDRARCRRSLADPGRGRRDISGPLCWQSNPPERRPGIRTMPPAASQAVSACSIWATTRGTCNENMPSVVVSHRIAEAAEMCAFLLELRDHREQAADRAGRGSRVGRRRGSRQDGCRAVTAPAGIADQEVFAGGFAGFRQCHGGLSSSRRRLNRSIECMQTTVCSDGWVPLRIRLARTSAVGQGATQREWPSWSTATMRSGERARGSLSRSIAESYA